MIKLPLYWFWEHPKLHFCNLEPVLESYGVIILNIGRTLPYFCGAIFYYYFFLKIISEAGFDPVARTPWSKPASLQTFIIVYHSTQNDILIDTLMYDRLENIIVICTLLNNASHAPAKPSNNQISVVEAENHMFKDWETRNTKNLSGNI
jgi:hypothetical protein